MEPPSCGYRLLRVFRTALTPPAPRLELEASWDRSLFRARLHPFTPGAQLGPARARRLYDAIAGVLTEAIAAGGSPVSDYVDDNGRQGFFQFSQRVYQRTGEPCAVCGPPIRRTLVAQSGTHYWAHCQRR